MMCAITIQRNAREFLNSRNPEKSLHEAHMKARQPLIDRLHSIIKFHLQWAQRDTLRKMREITPWEPWQANAKDDGSHVIFDQKDFAESLMSAVSREYAGILDDAGTQLFEELGEGEAPESGFTLPGDDVKRFIAGRQNFLAGASQEIWDEVRAAYLQGREEGDSRNELADRIKKAFAGIEDGRARTVASTETAAAYGYARHQGLLQAPTIKSKRWLCAFDNSRAAHIEAHGQTVPIGEPFTVMGEELMYPGDESGSPENVINCHCIELAA